MGSRRGLLESVAPDDEALWQNLFVLVIVSFIIVVVPILPLTTGPAPLASALLGLFIKVCRFGAIDACPVIRGTK